MNKIDKLLQEFKIKPIDSYKTIIAHYRIFKINGKTYCLSFCPIGNESWVFSCEEGSKTHMLYMGYSQNEVKKTIKEILEAN